MQSTKKAQLAAALAATLGFALHGAATAADYGSDTTGADTTKPTPIATGKDASCSGKKGKTSKCSAKGKSSKCSADKGKSSKCSSGKESSCSSKK